MSNKNIVLGNRRIKIASVLVVLVLAVLFNFFAAANVIEETRYMTGSSHTVNGYSADALDVQQTDSAESALEEADSGDELAEWGTRVWIRGEDESEQEITAGSPEAIVTRSAEGEGIQTATLSVPETELEPGDAVITRTYIRVGGGSWFEASEHITERVQASRMIDTDWDINYYTQYETQSGGPPGGRFTRGTFRWGSDEFNSRIEGFTYEEARLEIEQTNPDEELDTWPGDDFEHEFAVTCEAGNCEDVEIVPQACTGRNCEDFEDVNDGNEFDVAGDGDLSWNEESVVISEMSRGDTATDSITVEANEEGEYRIRYRANSSNVKGNFTDSQVVDVHVAEVTQTGFTHQNRDEVSLDEYEAGDTIDYFDTTLTSDGGTAFNLSLTPEILDPEEAAVSWGPDSTESCGNLSDGESCGNQFGPFQIPADAEEGEYIFENSFDWENFGPETDDSERIQIVNVKDSFSSVLQEDSIFQGEETIYEFSLTNRWSEEITDVDVTVNCPEELTCQPVTQDSFDTLNPGEQAEVSFEVSSEEDTPTGFYDISSNVIYDNPNEQRTWTEQEEETLSISSQGSLVTEIMENFPERITRGQLLDLEGNLENTGEEAEEVSLNWTAPEGWEEDEGSFEKLLGTVEEDGIEWNNMTTEVTLSAETGEKQVELASNNSDGSRSDLSRETLDVFKATETSLELNDTDPVHGDSIKATVELADDRGAELENQEIRLKDETDDRSLGISDTDSSGEVEFEFKVGEDWSVGDHIISAEYRENSSIYADPSSDTSSLTVSDFPKFEDITEEPVVNGFGYNTTITANVTSEDGIDTVEANIVDPEGAEYTKPMESSENSIYTGNFSETWRNGVYNYSLTANTTSGVENTSSQRSFEVRGNSSLDIVTGQDIYSPRQDVLLDREDEVIEQLVNEYSTLTQEITVETLYSTDFSTREGSSGIHTNTHEQDGNYFEMTERGGSPPDTPAEFDGIYTYETELDDAERLEISSLGSVDNTDGGSWDVLVRNFETDEWELLFDISENTDVWNNVTICDTGCNDYVRNSQLEIRAFTQSDRGTDEFTYSVDYQEIEYETPEGPVEKEDGPETFEIGDTGDQKNRYYDRYPLDIPVPETASIEEATINFSISEPGDQGEVHHVGIFDEEDGAEEIHRSEEPGGVSQTNPIAVFDSEDKVSVDVTQSVQDSFQAGNQSVGLQIRGEGESFELEEKPVLEVKYSSDSLLTNLGATDKKGYLVMRVQRQEDGTWENIDFPVVDASDGIRLLNESEQIDLAQIWSDNGAWNTGTRDSGTYRVLSQFTDEDGEVLQNDNGEKIEGAYSFEIEEAELNLTDVFHSNQFNHDLNEFETTDNIDWVNVTIENIKSTAVEASVNLNILDENFQNVEWGPDSTKSYGDLEEGEEKQRQWNNDNEGYFIPEDAASGTFEFRWNATLDSETSSTEINDTYSVVIHNLAEKFESGIEADNNRVFRNESTVYEFSMTNDWSQAIQNTEITVSCNEQEIGCNVLGGTGTTFDAGTLASGDQTTAEFNLTTDEDTDVGDYDINVTVDYTSPTNNQKTWNERENEILRVRIPGALLDIEEAPQNVTRGEEGYVFEALSNNTNDEDLTDVKIQWGLPERWSNVTGTLTETKDVQEPGEIIWNNFTAGIDNDAEIGAQEVKINATNDQGREDNLLVDVDVLASTQTDLRFNDTSPAINETVLVTGELSYDNGTSIEGKELGFTDEETGEKIGNGFTDSQGEYSFEYVAPEPQGEHIINVTFNGSQESYLNPSYQEQAIDVTGRPNVSQVEADPDSIGFGINTTLSAEVEDDDGVDTVEVEVTDPEGESYTEQMEHISGEEWATEFSDTWTEGEYVFEVTATNTAGNQDTDNSTFNISISELSTVQTERDQYFPREEVLLTEKQVSWWDQDWSSRTPFEIEEQSGNQIERYPVQLQLEHNDSATCDDLRAVEDLQTNNLYVESCDDEQASVWVEKTLGPGEINQDSYLYYGNEDAPSYGEETFAYRIEDTGSVGGSTNLDEDFRYNSGEAIFRQAEVTVFGDSLDAEVRAYNYLEDEWEILYSGQPGTGETIITEQYYENPRYSEFTVQLQDTSNNPDDVSFDYDFTTPDVTDAVSLDEQDRLPSLIENIGDNDFNGRVLLELETNQTGEWETVSTRFNDTETREILSGETENLGALWNQEPWETGGESGFYRAVFNLVSPDGDILGEDPVTASHEFFVSPPRTEVEIDQINIFNVTGAADRKTDTSQLEDSGLNETLRVTGGETYRFDIVVENLEEAEADWNIKSEDEITHFNFNQDWPVDAENEVFYSNQTEEFTGGIFDGDISWNTSLGGTVRPGDSANFSFVIDIDDVSEERDIQFRIEDSVFERIDKSELRVVEVSDQPPEPLDFGLNSTEVRRSEDTVKAFAEWDTDIEESDAEYNSTTEFLNNFTVTPENEWTNYTFETDTDWLRGEHQFRFYATDYNGNQNSTWLEWFDIFATVEIVEIDLSPEEVDAGEETTVTCRVQDDRGENLEGYYIEFYDEDDTLHTTTTDSEGLANTTYSTEEIGQETMSCGIFNEKDDYYVTHGDSEFQTMEQVLTVGDPDAPQYQDFGSNVTRIFKTTENSVGQFFSEWNDTSELDFGALTINNNESTTGDLPESLFNYTELEGEQDWANFTVSPPDSIEPQEAYWNIHVNDTSGNVNATGNMDVDIWAWSMIDFGQSEPNTNLAETDQDVTMECRVMEGNSSSLNGYEVEFYDNSTGSKELLGTNSTEDGFSQFTTSYSETGFYEFFCEINDDSENFVEAYPENDLYSELIEIREEVDPPVIVDSNYGLNTSRVVLGESILSFAQWDREIDDAWVEYNFSSDSGKVEDGVPEPYTDEWTNYTLDVNESWEPGEYGIKTIAEDTTESINDTLEFLKYEAWSRSEVEWVDPVEEATRGEVVLQCRVSDEIREESIDDYNVEFYDEEFNLLGENSTNSTGDAVLDIDATDEEIGDISYSCIIEDDTDKYYETGDQDSDSETFKLLGGLNSTIDRPEELEDLRRGEEAFLNSTTLDDQDDPVTVDSAEWFNSTQSIASGEDSTWEVWNEVGRNFINLTTTKEDYSDGEDAVEVEVFGNATPSVIEPAEDSVFSSGAEVELRCSVDDSWTGEGVSGYNVDFVVENSTDSFDIGNNTTDSSGEAVEEWDTTGFEEGEYYPGCIIEDEPENYYFAEAEEVNTTVELSEAAGKLVGEFVEPATDTNVAQNRTFTANISVTCEEQSCGEVTSTLRYNQSGEEPDTEISETEDTPFHTLGSSNPDTCSESLSTGETCYVNWEVNATGEEGSRHALDAELQGTQAQTNSTNIREIGIEVLLIMNVEYDEINFPRTDPGQTTEAENNTDSIYNIELDENSNDATDGLWTKMTPLEHVSRESTDEDGTNAIISPENTTWDTSDTCLYEESTRMSSTFQSVVETFSSGETFSKCYFQEIPFGKYEGVYNGNLTIKVNRTD